MTENKTLWILRGVSGAGKTTVAKSLLLLPSSMAYAADDFHYDEDGSYNWKPENVKASHEWCQRKVSRDMWFGFENIIVHNTNTTEKEIQPYLDLAEKYEYDVVSLVVENRHGNKDVHNVPQDIRDNQEKRLRNSLKLQ